MKKAIAEWLENADKIEGSEVTGEKLKLALEPINCECEDL